MESSMTKVQITGARVDYQGALTYQHEHHLATAMMTTQ